MLIDRIMFSTSIWAVATDLAPFVPAGGGRGPPGTTDARICIQELASVPVVVSIQLMLLSRIKDRLARM